MLHQLLESGARPQTRGSWTLASSLVHASLIGAAMVLTARPPALFHPATQKPEALVFVGRTAASAPASPATSATRIPAAGKAPRVPSINIPMTPVIADPASSRIHTMLSAEPTGSVTGSGGRAGEAPLGNILSVTQVDRVVVPLSESRPEYPSGLRRASVEGEVVVRFVVDSAGRTESGSIQIVRETHAFFGESVRRWLAGMRYRPAEADGRRVRQLVEQRVGFTVRD